MILRESSERSFRPNVVFLTPSFGETLLRSYRAQRDFRLVVTGAEPISEQTLTLLENKLGPVVNSYGSTEMGLVATTHISWPPHVRATCIGELMPGVQVSIELEGRNPRNSGELLIKHPYGFEGYIESSGKQLPAKLTSNSRGFRTGDLARTNADGLIAIVGRCDHTVKRRGRLVTFEEIERAIMQLNGVSDVAVIAIERSASSTTLVAYCVMENCTHGGSHELKAMCQRILPIYAIPDEFVVVDFLPRLPSGKLHRQGLTQHGLSPTAT